MKEDEPKRFLKTLQEKIYNINSGNEIDNEEKYPPTLDQNLQKEDKLEDEKKEEEKINEEEKKIDDEDDKKMEEEEKIEKEEEEIEEEGEKYEKEEEENIDEEQMYEEQLYEERIYEDKNSENNNFSPEITPKNIYLKESIPYPIETNNIQNEEPINLNSNDNNNIKINSPYIQKYASIKSAICKNHGKSYLKVNPFNFEIICEKCMEENKISQLKIINSSNNNFDDEEERKKFNCFEHQNL